MTEALMGPIRAGLRRGARIDWNWRREKRQVTGMVLLAIASLVWFLALRPGSLGGPATYVIVNGTSMEPALVSGDLAVLRQRDAYAVGDVVAFRVGGGYIIHRIIGGTAVEGYILQGDNRELPDHWRPTPDEIAGRMWLRVPAAGNGLVFVRDPRILASIAGALSFLMVLYGGGGRTPQRSGQADPR